MFVKKKMKMKNRSYREDINTPHLEIDTSIANIRSLSVWYIWSSIHELVKQHWGWVKKKSVA